MTTDPKSTAGPERATPGREVAHASYVHIPFCAHKCGYCDFASVAGQDEWADRYLDALDHEMKMILGKPRPVETIFVGGGTPTYLSAEQLEVFLSRLTSWHPVLPTTEFTVESNPNTLTPEKVNLLADFGVNRVSLGAQSFKPQLLQQLERNHEPASVGRAMESLRRRIDNVSIDLIFGIPGETMEDWRHDLDSALDLEPSHLSAYGLTYEKGTPLWKQRKLGIVQPIDEDREAAMYEHLLERTAARGYEQYEISNFARRGSVDRRCRHNGVYWANEPYFGFGTGAAAYLDGARTLNLRPLVHYMETVENGESPICQSETLDPDARARETAVLQLRRLEGITRTSFEVQTGISIDRLAGEEIRRWVEMELLVDDGASIRLSTRGLLLADGILARIV